MKKLPFSIRIVQEANGKSFVVKHYRHGIILTKNPGMSRVKPSKLQCLCRSPFRKATAFAKAVYQDLAQKQHWQIKIGKPRRLFQAILKEYLRMVKALRKRGIKPAPRWAKGKTLSFKPFIGLVAYKSRTAK